MRCRSCSRTSRTTSTASASPPRRARPRGLAAPSPQVAAALVDALVRIRARDDAITFEALAPTWPARHPTSVLVEIIEAIGQLGAAASGERARLIEIRSAHAPTWSPAGRRRARRGDRRPAGGVLRRRHRARAARAPETTPRGDPADIGAVVLEDQDGRRTTFAEWFGPAPAVVAFFYTRCPNPNKCSLTVIAKLGRLARRLAGRGVRVAGITYDPGFDDASRLRAVRRGPRRPASAPTSRCCARSRASRRCRATSSCASGTSARSSTATPSSCSSPRPAAPSLRSGPGRSGTSTRWPRLPRRPRLRAARRR